MDFSLRDCRTLERSSLIWIWLSSKIFPLNEGLVFKICLWPHGALCLEDYFFLPPNQRFLDHQLSLRPRGLLLPRVNRLDDGTIPALTGSSAHLSSPGSLSLSFSLPFKHTHILTKTIQWIKRHQCESAPSRTPTSEWVAHTLKSSSSAFGFRIIYPNLKSHSWCKWQALTQSDFVSHSLFSHKLNPV